MGLWKQIPYRRWWPFGAGIWQYSPFFEGNDNPNLPPPSLQQGSKRGPVYHSSDGHTYRTWIFPDNPYRQYVDFREKLDVTDGDPNSFEVTRGQ